jgi:hypothetical protein
MGTKLKTIKVTNIGCIGSEGLKVELDDIVCLTGKNDSGKSTLLDSYVYAYENNLPEDKKCKWGNGNPTIELWFYVSEEEKLRKKWCDEYGVAHIKWEWNDEAKTQKKWEAKHTGKNHSTGKDEPNPLGAYNVFKSYLPKPIRISSLDASSEKKETEIFKDLLENFIPTDPESKIYRTFNEFKNELDTAFKDLSNSEDLKNKTSRLQKDYKKVVSSSLEPSFDCNLNIDSFKLDALVASNSKISLTDGTYTFKFHEQGTGAQRALFWSLLQHFPNKPSKSGKPKGKKSNTTDEELEECQEKRIILLIDEPENALHPHAIQKACELLYEFSKEEHKQVILTTHSPYFVNPTEDHTTIVRLERKDNITTPKAFRAEKCKFEEKELDNLKMLLKMDTALCEVFFGGYPIIVEGDTEYLSFLELAQEDDVQNALEEQNQEHFKIIRAVGKDTIIPIAKILAHFKVDFSVLHDLDNPLTEKDKKKSPAWSANERIFNCLLELKEKQKITVGHRVSNHTFEKEHAPIDTVPSKEKPWKMLEKIKEKQEVRDSVKVELIRLIKAENAFEGITQDEFMPLILSWHETKNQTDSIAS